MGARDGIDESWSNLAQINFVQYYTIFIIIIIAFFGGETVNVL